MPDQKTLTATDLHAYLAKEGAPQDKIEVLKNMPAGSNAANGVSALAGAGLSHRFLERAQAFVDGNGNPAPEPAKAWEKPAEKKPERPASVPASSASASQPRPSER